LSSSQHPISAPILPFHRRSRHRHHAHLVRVISDRVAAIIKLQPVGPVLGLANGLPQKDCYVNVLREAMAVDSMDDCGIYFGTTSGEVYCSPDGGDHWHAINEHFPSVLSVEVQTLR
jgi:hypothetical protein